MKAGKFTSAAAAFAMLVGTSATPALAQSAPQTSTAPRENVARPAMQTDDDWARISAAGVLTVGTSADYPPFEFYSSNYKLDGFDVALMTEIGERLGVKIAWTDFAFDGLLDALNLNQVDAAIAAISVTPERMNADDFSNIYYFGNDAALAKSTYKGTIKSTTDLAGKQLGVQRGTTYAHWVQQELVDKGLSDQSDITQYSDAQSMVRDVQNGKIELALLGALPAKDYAKRLRGLKVVGEGTNKQQFGIAARNGSTLIQRFNQALLQVQADGTYGKLVKEYLNAKESEVKPQKPDIDNVPMVPPTSTQSGPPPCVYGMSFIADITFDDKNMTAPPVMQPGQKFVKTWRIMNSGNCAWQADFAMAYVRGNTPEARMGGQDTRIGQVVQPGQQIDVSVNLQAPYTPGTYQGFWQMRTQTFQFFGQTVWVGITVPNPNPPPPPPPPTPQHPNPNLRADSTNIQAGQCTTIRWDIDNVNAVFFVDGNGNATGVSGHDSRQVCPTQTTTYNLRVTYKDGTTINWPITINVSGQPTIQFWADSTTINQGQCTTLHWNVQNVQAVFLNDQGVAGQGSQQVCPNTTTTYTLRVVMRDGSQQTRQITINVVAAPPAGPTINSFTVDHNQISQGQCVNFSWSTSNASSINLSRNGTTVWGSAPASGTFQDCPPGTGLYEYTLTASGSGGSTTQQLTVNVNSPGTNPPVSER